MNRLTRLLPLIFLAFIAVFVVANPTTAQEETPLPAPFEAAEAGKAIFDARCATCHGETGQGDGPQAPDSIQPPTPLANPAFQNATVTAGMYSVISSGLLERGMPPFGAGTSNPLSDEEILQLTAAIYAFTFSAETSQKGLELAQSEPQFSNAITTLDWLNLSNEEAATALSDLGISGEKALQLISYVRTSNYAGFTLTQPLPTATLRGQVLNGATQAGVADVEVLLRAFDNFQPVLTITTTTSAEGDYSFELSDVAQSLAYIVSAEYEGTTFSSPIAQLSRNEPFADLLISVYDATTDSSVITIDNLQIILDFAPGSIQVSEYYQFFNSSDHLFVGESGNTDAGSIAITLPAAATDIDFQHGSGSNFFPAEDIIQTETGWLDTIPLLPGPSQQGLLVRYLLPYEDGMTFAHPIDYPVTSARVVLPENGVTLAEKNGWAFDGSQQFGDPPLTFNSYQNSAQGKVEFQLEGQAGTVVSAQGNTAHRGVERNEQSELLIGGGALMVTLAAAAYLTSIWKQQPAIAKPTSPKPLLKAIAKLDDDHATGSLNDKTYKRKRSQLMDKLRQAWRNK